MHNLNPVMLGLAMSRAKVTPFTPDLWSAYAGAMGDAHLVEFHAQDAVVLAKQLGITHWDPTMTTVVLDDGGITWNGMSPTNAYAWQVTVPLVVECHEPGTPAEYWEVSDRFSGIQLETDIALLPPELRAIVLACPDSARGHVVAGIKQQQELDRARLETTQRMAAQLTPFEAEQPEPADLRLVPSELAHDWGGTPRPD